MPDRSKITGKNPAKVTTNLFILCIIRQTFLESLSKKAHLQAALTLHS